MTSAATSTPPPLDTFGQFRLPDGTPWTPRSKQCRDDACVAIAHGPAGWVALMDTKNPHRRPLFFTAAEWLRFTSTLRTKALTKPEYTATVGAPHIVTRTADPVVPP